ncbi:ORF6N domain-containing protein, partial [Xenorhabdus littoralis]|uniref:ORF6N domain-containing protein n=1 Tax=Xenorhabdus littoralis TaxID=2582835 RepID=UPI0029E81810
MLSITVKESTKHSHSVEHMAAIMHNSIPVITTELLANVYETNVNNIKVNHSRNAARFIEGKHYFKLTGSILREFKHKITQSNFVKIAKNVRHLTLWTERGAARHAKMLDTDQAWNIFEKLEDFYFNQKEAEPVAIKTTTQDRTPLRGLVNIIMG